jgi:hypothetical protein
MRYWPVATTMGDATVPEVVSLAKESAAEAEFIQRVQERLVGESGFMLFHEIDHGGWLTRFGINRRVLRTAITMIRHGITAGFIRARRDPGDREGAWPRARRSPTCAHRRLSLLRVNLFVEVNTPTGHGERWRG